MSEVIQFFLSCYFPGKTLPHATPGMECDGCSRWVGPGSQWTTAQISSVADGIRSQFVGSAAPARACLGSMASTECSAECNAPTTSTRTKRGVGGRTFESLQFWEAALAAMVNHQGPEVDALRSALSKAKQAAQERPLKVQLAHTAPSIERSPLRIPKLDQERKAKRSF